MTLSESLLCLVILDALGGEGWDSEINRLCDELIEHFGNAERAIDAIRCGGVEFARVTTQ